MILFILAFWIIMLCGREKKNKLNNFTRKPPSLIKKGRRKKGEKTNEIADESKNVGISFCFEFIAWKIGIPLNSCASVQFVKCHIFHSFISQKQSHA